MSSITDYFERTLQEEHRNHASKWFTIAAGILFVSAGAILETRIQNLSKSASFIAIGLGMVLFGITQTKLHTSPWRWPMLIAELALWFGGVYWLLHTIL